MNSIQKVIKIAAICFAVFLIVNIFGGILWGISFLTDIKFTNNHDVVDFEKSYDNITSIDIDISTANIIVKSGNEFKIDATNMNKSFSSKEKNGKLVLKEKDSWFWHRNVNGSITVYVPYDVKLNELEIDNGAGEISIEGIRSYKLNVEQGAGRLEINDSQFDNTDIDGGAGEVKVTLSTLNNLDMDSGVGKIVMEALITGNSKIDCGVGELDITLLGKDSDYRILAQKGIGSIKIAGVNQSNDSVYGSGTNRLELDGGVGSINIDFKEFFSQ